MKLILTTIIICLNLNSIIFTQDNRYTKGADNGYAWISLSQPTNKLTDYKQNYLASLLENQKIKKMSGVKIFPLFDCNEDVLRIDKSKKTFGLDIVVKMIDNFYSSDNNLIIPVLGAYCYCIKELAGVDSKELEKYSLELLNYSTEQSEQ